MANYFPHDENARSDEKILRLLRVKGLKGYGIFWALIEKLHERNGKILIANIPDIAYEFREDEENLLSVIREFGLFEIDGKYFSNQRTLFNLSERSFSSKRGKLAADARWRVGNSNADAMQVHSDGNADAMPIKDIKEIKESKGRPESFVEVVEYFNQQQILSPQLNAEKFFNHYEANGWMRGKNKIKNWRACVKTWNLPKANGQPKETDRERSLRLAREDRGQ